MLTKIEKNDEINDKKKFFMTMMDNECEEIFDFSQI